MLQRTEQARGLPYDNGVAPRHFDLVDLYAFLKSNLRAPVGYCRFDHSAGLLLHDDAASHRDGGYHYRF